MLRELERARLALRKDQEDKKKLVIRMRDMHRELLDLRAQAQGARIESEELVHFAATTVNNEESLTKQGQENVEESQYHLETSS